MINYIIEKTLIEDRETFLHIDKKNKTCCLYTADSTIFKKMLKLIGVPTKVFPPTTDLNNKNLISGASWTYHYDNIEERKKVRKMFNMSILFPRLKIININ